MNTKSKTKSLIEALEKLRAIESEFDVVCEATKDLDFYFDDMTSQLLDAAGAIAGLREELISRTDGRPPILDFSDRHALFESIPAPNNEEIRAEAKGEHWHFKNWAHCCTPGYEEKAFIGRLQASMADLARIRDWIDAVIEFHKQHPGKPSKVIG